MVVQNRRVSAMPVPGSDNGMRLVQAIWDLFEHVDDWPTVRQVANLLDRRHDLVFEDALPDVPMELLYGIHPGRMPSDGETAGLTLAGVAAAEGAAEDLRLVVAAVSQAAQAQRTWEAPADDRDADLCFTASDLAREADLPVDNRARLLTRVGALLRTENWGWSTAGHGATPADWSFTVDRRVRRFRAVTDISDFWARAHPQPQPAASEEVLASAPSRLDILDEPAAEHTNSRSSVTKRIVFLVHGRDHEARDALIELLRAFDLREVTWREAASQAAKGGTPYTGDIVRAGMTMADAVVVLLTPDDVGFVRPTFRQDRDGPDELRPTGQARLNVIFEAGMAMAFAPERVVLVEIGASRGLSDTAGIHTIRLNDHVESRKDFASRLRDTGLSVDTEGEAWRTAGMFDRPPLSSNDLTLASEGPSQHPEKNDRQAKPQQESEQKEPTKPKEGSIRLSETLVASRLDRLSTPHSTDVVGELANESNTPLELILLGATFYDQDGRIVGTASGSVNGLPGGATKSFRLASVGVVPNAASFKVQSNGQM